MNAPTSSSATSGLQAPGNSVPQAPLGRRVEGAEVSDDAPGAAGASVWASYAAAPNVPGAVHPGDVVEPASLQAVSLPPLIFPILSSLKSCLHAGTLSALQFEGVAYACQRHDAVLSSGSRAGFFIGDAAGIGKGRQIAGIVFDSLVRGRPKHVWFSTSSDLAHDAQRDLNDIGCYTNVIAGFRELDKLELKAFGSSKADSGVFFSTYAGLVAKNRFKQLIEWCGDADEFDGCLIFDEAHKAKNFQGDGAVSNSKVAQCVLDLQRAFPNARVVYCSATGISSLESMAYMERLGLWGANAPFRDFGDFKRAIGKKKEMSVLEMLALEFKATGVHVARSVGYAQAAFETKVVELSAAQIALYASASAFWQELREALTESLAYRGKIESAFGKKNVVFVGVGDRAAWSVFFGAHQRFFKQLMLCLKVDTVVATGMRALENGECVVIGLQTTGEAALRRKAEAGELRPAGGLSAYLGIGHSSDDDDASSLQPFSYCKAIVEDFVARQLPRLVQIVEPSSSLIKVVDVADDLDVEVVVDERSLAKRKEWDKERVKSIERRKEAQPLIERLASVGARLTRRARELELPPAALDALIDAFGGVTKVAEMTGRRVRQMRERGKKRFVVSERVSASSHNEDSVNVEEKKKFMDGKKRVAIISDAASTGISLHADRRVPNQRRRVHITLELPWSATAAIQQLGRTHRTNQSSGPRYVLVNTGLGGENRFVAAVSKRLRAMGALTQGDRRATSAGASSILDGGGAEVDSKHGRVALALVYEVGLTQTFNDLPAASNGLSGAEKALFTLVKSTVQGYPLLQLAKATAQDASALLIGDGLTKLVVDDGFKPDVFRDELWEALKALGDSHEKNVEEIDRITFEHRIVTSRQLRDPDKTKRDVPRFLNRLLGCRVGHQALLFTFFSKLLEFVVAEDKREGTFDAGISDFACRAARRVRDPVVLHKDSSTGGAALIRHDVEVDRGMSFEEALALFKQQQRSEEDVPVDDEDDGMEALTRPGFYQMRGDPNRKRRLLICLARPATLARDVYMLSRPNIGAHAGKKPREDLLKAYQRVEDLEQARRVWDDQFDWAQNRCIHGDGCVRGGCNSGKRVLRFSILTGSVVPLWNRLEKTLKTAHLHDVGGLSRQERSMRILRVELSGAAAMGESSPSSRLVERLVGVRWPNELRDALGEALETMQWDAAARRAIAARGIVVKTQIPHLSNNLNDDASTDQDPFRCAGFDVASMPEPGALGLRITSVIPHSKFALENVQVGDELVRFGSKDRATSKLETAAVIARARRNADGELLSVSFTVIRTKEHYTQTAGVLEQDLETSSVDSAASNADDGQLRLEPPAPVSAKLLRKYTTAPNTITTFFKKAGKAPVTVPKPVKRSPEVVDLRSPPKKRNKSAKKKPKPKQVSMRGFLKKPSAQ